MQKKKYQLKNILIITDDIALPIDKIRIRVLRDLTADITLKNIIEVLSTTRFSRLKFGIGSDFKKENNQNMKKAGKWNDSEEKVVEKKLNLRLK